MINWQFFPKSKTLPDHLRDVIDVFGKNLGKIDSEKHKLESNDVLSVIRPGLIKLAYKVEKSKKAIDKIKVPVLFGRNRQD
jgi:hypothetical protein